MSVDKFFFCSLSIRLLLKIAHIIELFSSEKFMYIISVYEVIFQ